MKCTYVFGAAMAAAALGNFPGLFEQPKAKGAVVAGFSFEGGNNNVLFPSATFTTTTGSTSATTSIGTVTSTSTAGVTAAAVGPIIAESGIASAFGSHAAATTVYSEPAGNGSSRSFSSNNFAIGDYYQFNINTVGFNSLMLTFDQTSSGTGPKTFNLTYSADGVNFSTLTSYSFATVGFSGSSTSVAAAGKSFDLSGLTALNNDANVVLRLVDADTTATATAGTSRVDNVILNGTSTSVPEPASVALLSLAGGALIARRRRD